MTLQERLRALAAQEERDVENGLEGCSLEHTKAEREAADAIDAQAERIKALEGALRELIEDVEDEDHVAHDWSQQVVVKRAREALNAPPAKV